MDVSRRPSVREFHPVTEAVLEVPLTARRRMERLSAAQLDLAAKAGPFRAALAALAADATNSTLSGEDCERARENANGLWQVLGGATTDAAAVVLATECITYVCAVLRRWPSSTTLPPVLVDLLTLPSIDVDKFCRDEMVGGDVFTAISAVLQHACAFRITFDSSDGVEEAAALAVQALTLADKLKVHARGDAVLHLGSGLCAVVDRLCALVGVTSSPSMASVESQGIDGCGGGSATSDDVSNSAPYDDGPGVEASSAFREGGIPLALHVCAHLAARSPPLQQRLLELGCTASLFRVLSLYCPSPPILDDVMVEGDDHCHPHIRLPARQLPPLLACPFAQPLLFACHAAVQALPPAAEAVLPLLSPLDGLCFASFELWNLQRVLSAALSLPDCALIAPQSLDMWAWASDVSFQELSDLDPHSLSMALSMLMVAMMECSPSFNDEVRSMLNSATVTDVWAWEAWLAPPAPTSGTASIDATSAAVPIPPLTAFRQRYRDVLRHCAAAKAEHHDEDVVTSALEDIQTLITQPTTTALQIAGDVAASSSTTKMTSSSVRSPILRGADGSTSALPLLPITSTAAFVASSAASLSTSALIPALPSPSPTAAAAAGSHTTSTLFHLSASPRTVPAPQTSPVNNGAGKDANGDAGDDVVSAHGTSAAVFAAFVMFHAHPCLDVLVAALQNIDGGVMVVAADTLACLLAAYPPGRGPLHAAGGIHALAECLYDYDHDIRRSALQCVSLLASPSFRPSLLPFGSDLIATGLPDRSLPKGSQIMPPRGHDLSDVLRECGGLLGHVCGILAQWPNDDVTDQVATAAAWVLAHATASSTRNQGALGAAGVCALLTRVIQRCCSVDSDDDGYDSNYTASRAKLWEAAISALGNLLFRHPANQCRALRDGSVLLCLRVLAALFVDHACARAGSEAATQLVGASAAPTDDASCDDGTAAIANDIPAITLPSTVDCGGTVESCAISVWTLLQGDVQTATSIVTSTLIALINAVAGCVTVQGALDTDGVEALVLRLLQGGPKSSSGDALPPVLAPGYRKQGCLLLSHLVAGHARNQQRFVGNGVDDDDVSSVDENAALPLLCRLLAEIAPTALLASSADVISDDCQDSGGGVALDGTPSAPGKPSTVAAVHEYVGDALGEDGSGASTSTGAPVAGNDTDDILTRLRISTEASSSACEPAVDSDVDASLAHVLALELAELRVCALTCVVNVTYKHKIAQDVVGRCGGVATVVKYLRDPHPSVVKTAAYCLGNLVRDHTGNGRLLVECGGVEALVDVINDVQDDETSKKAFATLGHCGPAAVHRLLCTVEAAASMFPPRPGFPHRVLRSLDKLSMTSQDDGGDICSFVSSSRALAWLDTCLPVLNGLILTRPSNNTWLLSSEQWWCGVWPLTKLVCLDIPQDMRVYACVVFANVCSGPQPTLQDVVHGQRMVLEALVYCCLCDDDADVSYEGAAVMHAALSQVCAGHHGITLTLARCHDLVRQLLGRMTRTYNATADAEEDGDQGDAHVSEESTELFLALCECVADDVHVSLSACASDATSGSGVTSSSIVWEPLKTGDTSSVVMEPVPHSELCVGLKTVQATQKNVRSTAYLRAEQCLSVLEGRAAMRGTGLALWK